MGSELFLDVFNSAAQRRRNGVVCVQGGNGRTEITFLEGRIVGVNAERMPTPAGICQRLYAAGFLHERVYELLRKSPVPLEQLTEMLVGRQFVSESIFRRARATHETNVILSLRLLEDASVEFQTRDIRVDLRFPWSASPGEFLLDMCELETDGEQFLRAVIGDGRERMIVFRSGELTRALTETEHELWQMLSEPRDVHVLFSALMTEIEVTEGLLALLELGLIEIRPSSQVPESPLQEESAGGEPHETVSDFDDAARDPESDLDLAPDGENEGDLYAKIATEAMGSMLDGFDDLTLAVLQDEPAEKSVPAPSGASSETDRSAPTTSPMRSATGAPVAPERSAPSAPTVQSNSPAPSRSPGSGRPQTAAPGGPAPGSAIPSTPQNVAPTSSTAQGGAPQGAVPAGGTVPVTPTMPVQPQTSLRDRFLDLNVWMMSRSVQEYSVFGTVLVFLMIFLTVSLTRFGPIDIWLRALERFTSAGG